MNSYTKIDGKYYKDNPEVQRVRNRLRPIYYKLAGGFTNYYALPKNERQKLNFGHTIGHAIESIYNLKHGESVGYGMIAACHI